ANPFSDNPYLLLEKSIRDLSLNYLPSEFGEAVRKSSKFGSEEMSRIGIEPRHFGSVLRQEITSIQNQIKPTAVRIPNTPKV
ncbi:MAG: hypothetical protein Q7J11_00535, partial [Candidatus Roizmanbacteria bacterium]|nr:hypothetical protein [Candidatus Roizmanbacteria bacterium]